MRLGLGIGFGQQTLLGGLLALISPNGDGTMTITSTGAGSARLVPVGDGTMTITSGG